MVTESTLLKPFAPRMAKVKKSQILFFGMLKNKLHHVKEV